MELSADEVRKVARLARLRLTPKEIDHLAPQLASILDYVHVLNEVDTQDVQPMAHAADVANVFREDASRPSLPREQALSNAPKTDGRFFLVPPILSGS